VVLINVPLNLLEFAVIFHRNHNRRLENRREKTNQKLNKIHAANKQLMEQINNYRINNKGQVGS
jgi:hypothetical protein